MPTKSQPKPTLVLLVRHGQTPTTGVVLPGRAAGLHLAGTFNASAEWRAHKLVAPKGNGRR